MRYRRWSPTEEDALRELFVAGMTDRQIAAELRRDEKAVTARRGALGLYRERKTGHRKRRWMVCCGMAIEIKETQ